MSVYLHDIPLPDAQTRLESALSEAGLAGILEVETIPLDENAVGRVVARPIWANLSSPHYHASAMDGFALRAEDTAGAAPTFPTSLEVGRQTDYVDTGDPLPAWSNAVIPIEQIWMKTVVPLPIFAIHILSACGKLYPPGATSARWARILLPPNWCCPPGKCCARWTWGRLPPAGTRPYPSAAGRM